MSNTNYEAEAARARSQTAQESRDFNLFVTLKPTLQRDGNQWCVLYGKDQVGIAGFGDSPYLAIIDFNKAWYARIT